MKSLFFITILTLSAIAYGREKHQDPAQICHAADFVLQLGESDSGVGQNWRKNTIQNVSQKTCVIGGYTVELHIVGYQNYNGTKIPHKRGTIKRFHIASQHYTMRPGDTLFFRTDESMPNADENPVIKKVMLIFDSVQGQFLWQDYGKGRAWSEITFEKLW